MLKQNKGKDDSRLEKEIPQFKQDTTTIPSQTTTQEEQLQYID